MVLQCIDAATDHCAPVSVVTDQQLPRKLVTEH